MKMKKKRYDLGLDKEVAIRGKQIAARLEKPFNRYVEDLIREDIERRLSKEGRKVEGEDEKEEFHILFRL